jgi:hypothetical protein
VSCEAAPFIDAAAVQFADQMGDEKWQFYRREHNLAGLRSPVEQYSRAYRLHPRIGSPSVDFSAVPMS